jgi:hypothetical protein
MSAVIDVLPEVAPEQETGTKYATRRVRGARHLTVVSPLRPERATRGAFVLLLTALLGIGLLSILLINTSLAQGAFVVSSLEREIQVLVEEQQRLEQDVTEAAGPVALEMAARTMGMVPTGNPAFVDLATGKILGKPKATKGARVARVPKLPGAIAPAVEPAARKVSTSNWSDPVVLAPGSAGPARESAPAPALEATLVE